jgi:hypothetical protein
VPPALFQVLDRAMAKVPARRYGSAAAVARALQQVETDLRLPVTPLDLTEEPLGREQRDQPDVHDPADRSPDGGQDDATRLRSIVSVDAQAPVVEQRPTVGFVPGADEPTRVRSITTVPSSAGPETPSPAPVARTGLPTFIAPEEPETTDDVEPVRRRTGPLVGIISGVVVLAAVAVLGAVALRGDDPDDRPGATTEFSPDSEPTAIDAVVPAPHSLAGTRQADGSVVFTWQNPDPQAGDKYLWGVLESTGKPELELIDVPTVTVPTDGGTGEVCIQVSIVREDRRASADPAQGCAS